LGEGGFAEVYLGEHIHLGTPAAIKILTTRLTDEGIALFRDEARTIIGLEHPHIVRVYDFGIEGHIPFIVMGFAPNGSLRKLHPKGTCLPLQTTVNYVKQVAAALQYAHDKKLIHRDIKPDNMLLSQNNEVLLSDFGIAVVAHSTRSLNTQDGSGTLYYMAPEQIQGKPRIASDQYALGIVVYEWLSGMPPFIGTATEIGMQHLLASPPPFREKNPNIASDVEQAVMRALAKDPYQRFASVQEFASELERVSKLKQSAELASTLFVPSSIIPSSAKPLKFPEQPVSSPLSLPVITDTRPVASSHQARFKVRYIFGFILYLILADLIGTFETSYLTANHLNYTLFSLGSFPVTLSTILFVLTLVILWIILGFFNLIPGKSGRKSPSKQRRS
jgi:serine/threonine protein kinase